MPVYEYRCEKCGKRFDQYRTVASRSVGRCPECGGRSRKILRPVGIIFKGPGFHVTDYRKPADKAKSGEKPGKAASVAEPPKGPSEKSG